MYRRNSPGPTTSLNICCRRAVLYRYYEYLVFYPLPLLLAACLLVVVALNVYEYATPSFRRYAQLSDHFWLSIPYLHLDNLYDRHIFSNKMPAILCFCGGNVFDLSGTSTRLQAMAPYKQDSGKIHGLHRDTRCSTAGFLTLNLT